MKGCRLLNLNQLALIRYCSYCVSNKYMVVIAWAGSLQGLSLRGIAVFDLVDLRWCQNWWLLLPIIVPYWRRHHLQRRLPRRRELSCSLDPPLRSQRWTNHRGCRVVFPAPTEESWYAGQMLARLVTSLMLSRRLLCRIWPMYIRGTRGLILMMGSLWEWSLRWRRVVQTFVVPTNESVHPNVSSRRNWIDQMIRCFETPLGFFGWLTQITRLLMNTLLGESSNAWMVKLAYLLETFLLARLHA